MIRRVMLDMETLGTAPGSIFFSVAVVEFTGGQLGAEAYWLIDPRDAGERGLTHDTETVLWWMDQGPEAWAELQRAKTEGAPLFAVLESMRDWLSKEELEIWANAPTFDCALLRAGFGCLCLRVPWNYTQERCYRTLKKLRPDVSMKREGTHHRALDDARDQARHAIALLEALGCADWPTAAPEAEAAGYEFGTRVLDKVFPRGGQSALAATTEGACANAPLNNELPEMPPVSGGARGGDLRGGVQ